MRSSFTIVLVLTIATGVLRAGDQQKTKPEPADRKAYTEARKIEDPQKKIDALRQVVNRFPKSSYAGRANDLIFDTLIEKFPKRTEESGKQADLLVKSARGSKISKAYEYADIADSLADGGVLLDRGEKLIRKARRDFGEKPFLANEKKGYAAAKMKVPSEDEMTREYRRNRAEMTATLGRILVKQGNVEEGRRLLEEAYRTNPTLFSASAALGRLAVEKGDRGKALDYFTQACLTGILKAEDRKQFEALYRDKHDGTLDGMDAWLDEEYRKRFPETVHAEPYKAGANRSDRVVLAEIFTGAGCPPCAGADAAMNAVMERYPRKDVAVLMYHQHIPHPDPMANPSTVDRASFYDVQGVPSTMFDGASDRGGGASRDEAAGIYDRFLPEIDKELSTPAEAHLILHATRKGEVVEVHASVRGVKSESKDLKLHVALVEKKLRYSGENGIRFHPMVVRSLCGIPIAAGDSQGDCTFDIAKTGAELKAYLDDYQQHNDRYGKFTFSEEKDAIDPRDLAVVAFVEDASGKHVLQAGYADLAEGR